ncbi:MAG TPA: RNA methyltransferase [Flavisolibacter sp.]|nr:RNA methyltransferase [Flavisolibacter sp.]
MSLKKNRDETNLFLAEGPKIVTELLQEPLQQVEVIYATATWLAQHQNVSPKVKIVEISEIELEKLSQLSTPNQVVGVFRQPPIREPEDSSFTLYLDTIQDPGNLGTLIRIADWFGIGAIVCSEGCADRFASKVVQSSMASIARVNVYYDKSGTWLDQRQQDTPLIAASLQGVSLYDQPKMNKGILLIGNESRGLKPELLQKATLKLTIPRKGQAESLNAAVATGIFLSHLLP